MERLARFAWRRWPSRFPTVFMVNALVVALVPVGIPGVLLLPLLFDVPQDRVIVFAVGVGLAVTVSLLAANAWYGAPYARTFHRWRDGKEDPASVLMTAVRVAPDYHVRVGRWATLPIVASASALGTWAADLTAAGTFAVAGISFLLVQVGLILNAVTLDVLLRPMREEVYAELQDAAVATSLQDASWGIETKLTVVVAATLWMVAMITPPILMRFDTPAGRANAALIVATVLAAFSAMVFFRLFALAPVLRPVEDLLDGTRRVAAGDLAVPLPVTSSDELGVLVASFNEMQQGLRERERLHSAFGSYVDPTLTERLLDQGGTIFEGEHIDVTVMFVDVRDFTTFAESNDADVTLKRLNDLFAIVVPAVASKQGHVNKFLGDGALGVFGAPERIDDHAGAAVAAAVEIRDRIHERFGDELRVGIGINSGRVIVGTIGAHGKLEFTLIGDPVNVAARVEQLTKSTGDDILMTEQTRDRLGRSAAQFEPRGSHHVKGRSQPITLYAVGRTSG